MTLQMAMFTPKSEWVPPHELPDITSAKSIAIDVETKDPNLKTKGPGWPTGDGEVVDLTCTLCYQYWTRGIAG